MRIRLNRFNIPEIFVGAFLAVAIFAMGMMFGSSRYQPAHQPTDAATQQIQTGHKPDPFSWEWFTHDGVVFFTFVLAVVAGSQAVLFLWQLRYMRKGMRDATIAARAASRSAVAAVAQAKIAREAFLRLERPYVYIFGVNKFENTWREVLSPHAKYTLANYGKTPAEIMVLSAAIGTHPEQPLDPIILDYRDDPEHDILRYPILSPGDVRPDLKVDAPDGIDFAPSSEGLVPQLNGQDEAFVWIRAQYRGPFGAGYETSACWRYDGLTNRLVQWGGDEYNYVK